MHQSPMTFCIGSKDMYIFSVCKYDMTDKGCVVVNENKRLLPVSPLLIPPSLLSGPPCQRLMYTFLCHFLPSSDYIRF